MPVKKSTKSAVKAPAKSATKSEAASKSKPEKFIIPKNVGACADLIMDLKAQKSAQQKIVDDIGDKITALQEHLINTLPKSEATGAVGKVAKALIKVTQEPAVENWDLFYAHIAKTKSWDLLSRAISKPAIRERWESKKQVPGVGTTPVIKVSVTKI